MPITLEQAKVGMADKVVQSVIDEFQRESFILDRLTFDNAVSPGTGGSTMTYGYTQLLTPSLAEGRKINSEYVPGEALRTKKTADIKIFGGSFEVDRVLETTAAQSEIAFQLKQKTIATKNKFHYDFINGDSENDALDFDGVDKLVTGTDTEVTPESSIDISDITAIKANAGALALQLHDWLGLLAAEPDALLMNKTTMNKLTVVANELGYKTESEDAFGRKVKAFDGIPMIDMGKYFDGTNSVDVVEIDEKGETSIYAVKFGLDALHGISPVGNKVVNAYLPDLSQPGAVKKGEVEMLAGIVLKNSKMAGVLRKVKVAASKNTGTDTGTDTGSDTGN